MAKKIKHTFCMVSLCMFALVSLTLAKSSEAASVFRRSGANKAKPRKIIKPIYLNKTGHQADGNDCCASSTDKLKLRETGIDGHSSIKKPDESKSKTNTQTTLPKETIHQTDHNQHKEQPIESNNAEEKTKTKDIKSSSSVKKARPNKTRKEFSRRVFKQVQPKHSSSYSSGLGCSTCSVFFDVVRDFWTRPGISRVLAKNFTITACISLRIQHSDVCIGIVREYENEIFEIFGKVQLSSEAICSALLDKHCGDEEALDRPWTVALPNTQKPTVKERRPIQVYAIKK